ncbi:hypothetical protein H5T53_05540 [Candidatus Bipolaricaulota bacterium]|nr:hypothetical protein [Candidatus Bipolaricaulota bacterium]
MKKEPEDASLRAAVPEEELEEARKELARLKGRLEEYAAEVQQQAHRREKQERVL